MNDPAIAAEPRPMTPHAVERLVVYILAYPEVARAALAHLQPEDFLPESHFEMLWLCFREVSARPGVDGASFDVLDAAVRIRVVEAEPPLDPRLAAILLAGPESVGREATPGDPSTVIRRPGVLHEAFVAFDPADASPEYALGQLQRFLRERIVDACRRHVVDRPGGQAVGDALAALWATFGRLDRIGSLGRPLSRGLSDPLADAVPVETFPTGADCFDDFLGGFQAAGEVYYLQGEPKVGTTVQAVQLAVSAAEHFFARSLDGDTLKTAVIVHYDMTRAEIGRPVYARGARVSQRRQTYEIRRRKELSGRGALLEYEEAMYRSQGRLDLGDLPGERERVDEFTAGPGRAILSLDMSVPECVYVCGGVDGLACLLQEIRREGGSLGLVVVDYVGMAIRRTLPREGDDADGVTPALVRSYIREVVEKIAVPFEVPVWLIDKFHVENASSASVEELRIAHAAETRAAGEDADAAFCIEYGDELGVLRRISCVHSRRTDSAGRVRLTRLDWDLGRFRDDDRPGGMYGAAGAVAPEG
ncbi:hypothetical protein [Paludisphaera soli]|uniref:hypothetical protein n=1 Tax=Paludisphaera soli TaxID=2712865 RepID=UPI0013EA8842|nr:hypothetical protein [Paludisphaera soli]